MLRGKRVLVGITGSIAAYKIPLLIRLLKKAGAEVQVILTPDAHNFVTPLTLSVLSENPVLTSPFNPDDGTWNSHVEMGLHADLMLIAPASANTMARMTAGIADNLLLTTWLAARCPVFFAPAMDLDMYKHPTTQRNIESLCALGNVLIEPGEGELASGLCGAGRMEEPEVIMEVIRDWFAARNDFAGRKVLVTAGPTLEPMDPVRFLSNHSSGKMGYAIAEEFANRGAEVHLVSGPVQIRINHPGVQVLPVTTALEMHETCVALMPQADIVIMAAAVADYRPKSPMVEKIKKGDNQHLTVELVKNPDILLLAGKEKRPGQLVVGFALETNDGVTNAKQKMHTKQADLIVLNTLEDSGAGFGTDTNKVTLIGSAGKPIEMPLMSKREVAAKLADHIHGMIAIPKE